MIRISIGIWLLTSLVAGVSLSEGKGRPNIIVYLADDLGYGSVEPYGADGELVSTPAIQRLADEGVSYLQAYATASVCSPTRYGLLTGRYSWRGSLQYGVVNAYDPLLIEAEVETLPAWLKERGYTTAHIGKWHLGYTSERMKNLLGKLSPGPNTVGFDYHFGVPNNMDDLHKVYVENEGIYGLRSAEMSAYGKSYYGVPYAGYDAPQRDEPEIMEELTRRAVRWIEEQERSQPFFLYFCPVAVHHPVLPSKRMRGTSSAGAYGDFIQDLDHSLGELMASLERLGIMENTLIIFASDNGGDIPTDPSMPENLAIQAGLRINADLRGDKHTIYEGGLRIPFIVSWGEHLPAGLQSEALVTTADIFATVAELLEPERGPKSVGMDSYSFARTLKDPSQQSIRTHAIFRDVDGRKALRFGAWKLVDNYFPHADRRKGTIELYNLSNDPAEQRNVSDDYPDVVEEAYGILKRNNLPTP